MSVNLHQDPETSDMHAKAKADSLTEMLQCLSLKEENSDPNSSEKVALTGSESQITVEREEPTVSENAAPSQAQQNSVQLAEHRSPVARFLGGRFGPVTSSTAAGSPSSSPDEPSSIPRHTKFVRGTYKTELCRTNNETGYCEYGASCQFAHGLEDLRPRDFGSLKYKTQACKNFHSPARSCRFGSRCRFLHDEQRIQISPSVSWLIAPTENLIRVEVQVPHRSTLSVPCLAASSSNLDSSRASNSNGSEPSTSSSASSNSQSVTVMSLPISSIPALPAPILALTSQTPGQINPPLAAPPLLPPGVVSPSASTLPIPPGMAELYPSPFQQHPDIASSSGEVPQELFPFHSWPLNASGSLFPYVVSALPSFLTLPMPSTPQMSTSSPASASAFLTNSPVAAMQYGQFPFSYFSFPPQSSSMSASPGSLPSSPPRPQSKGTTVSSPPLAPPLSQPSP